MDVIFPHYLNDSEHLQIQCIFPWAEYESWAVRGLKHSVTDIADKAEGLATCSLGWVGKWHVPFSATKLQTELPSPSPKSSIPEQHLTPLVRCLVSHSGS